MLSNARRVQRRPAIRPDQLTLYEFCSSWLFSQAEEHIRLSHPRVEKKSGGQSFRGDFTNVSEVKYELHPLCRTPIGRHECCPGLGLERAHEGALVKYGLGVSLFFKLIVRFRCR